MSNEKSTEITDSKRKPVWQAPTLVEFQDVLAPQGGSGSGIPDELDSYAPPES